jgi:C-terminal processing protease CtpA/Prc
MKRLHTFNWIVVFAMLLAACGTPTTPTTPPPPPTNPTPSPEPTKVPEPISAIPDGPVKVTGEFSYTNDIITTYYSEQAVALVDLHGFVTRDLEWEFPVESQILGYLELDPEAKTGTYSIDLPAQPRATNDDVDQNGQTNPGVQIFAASYWPNLLGSPYSVGDDRSTGWPTYLASVKTDTENKDEIIGGKIIVWAPDDQQQFPTGFGDDGLLFTADDPVGAIPVGYSVVDLDQKPFGISTEAEPALTLYEPPDAAIKDYSAQSYTEAFDSLFKSVSTNWAFNDIESKKVDWDALYKKVQPMVAEAEKNQDALAFYVAMHTFSLGIPDGHTGLSDSGDLGNTDFQGKTEGGYGFALREINTGKVIVIFLTPGGPAEAAGMKVGAEVTEWNGQPIDTAISQVEPYSGPFSLESSKRYQQVRYLLRTAVGVDATVTFTNPDGQPQTVTLTSVAERASFARTSIYFGAPTPTYPVEFQYLDSGSGYIRINSNYDDLGLIIRQFEYALKQFQAAGITTLIIDMRFNSGGAPLGLAGFFYDKEIILGQLEYYSDTTGQFEPEGKPEKFLPNSEQYEFEKIAVLVSPACASACEIESYGFAQLPNAIVVGMFPSAGVEAEVARGQYLLPEGISFQIPTGRFKNPDGSLFLEGTGVVPTVKVPITAENVLTTDDIVLQTAENAVLGIDPNDLKLEGGPIIGTAASGKKAFNQQINALEQVATENYSSDQLAKMDSTFTYTIPLDKDQRLLWGWGWCATSQQTLNENYQHIKIEFSVNGQVLDQAAQFAEIAQSGGGLVCKSYYTVVYHWPRGATQLQTVVTFDATINDGTADYAAGKQTFDYAVTLP